MTRDSFLAAEFFLQLVQIDADGDRADYRIGTGVNDRQRDLNQVGLGALVELGDVDENRPVSVVVRVDEFVLIALPEVRCLIRLGDVGNPGSP